MCGSGDVTMQVGCSGTHSPVQTQTHIQTHREITEPSFGTNRMKTEVERERSHWNGRTNYKRCVSKCGGKKQLLNQQQQLTLKNDMQNKHTHMLESTQNNT